MQNKDDDDDDDRDRCTKVILYILMAKLIELNFKKSVNFINLQA
jgi:hypothetical protein